MSNDRETRSVMVHLASGQSVQTEIETGVDSDDEDIVTGVRCQLAETAGFVEIGCLVVHSKAVAAVELL